MRKKFIPFFICIITLHPASYSQGYNFNRFFTGTAIVTTSSDNKPPLKIYARLLGSYGFPLSQSNIGIDMNYNGVGTSYKVVNGSYGKGVNIGLGAGYLVTDNIGVGLDIYQFIGDKYTLTSTNITSEESNVFTNASSVKGISLKPAVTLFTHPFKQITPFAEFGIAIAINDKMTIRNTNVHTQGNNVTTTISQKEIIPSIRPAAFAGIGTGYNFTDLLGIFLEIQVQGKSFIPKKANTFSYTVNGIDKLNLLDISQSQTLYDKTLQQLPSNPSLPSHALASAINCSSVAIMFGVCFGFGKDPVAKESSLRKAAYQNDSGLLTSEVLTQIDNIKSIR